MTWQAETSEGYFPESPIWTNLSLPKIINSPITPEVRKLAAVWQSVRQNPHDIPLKNALSIPKLGSLLPYLVIFERIDASYTIRLAGSEVENWLDRSLTGVDPLSLTPPFQRPKIEAVYSKVSGQPCGFYIRERVIFARGKSAETETLKLPLRDKDGNIRFFIAAYHFSGGNFVSGDAPETPAVHHQIDSIGFIDIGFGLPD